MCIATPNAPQQKTPVTPAAPSAREKTALEIIQPIELRERQSLAARLGVQQLRSASVNAPK